jgi:hypothetical protein
MSDNPLTAEWLAQHIEYTIDGVFNDDAGAWTNARKGENPNEILVKVEAYVDDGAGNDDVMAERKFRVTVEEIE